MGIYRSFLYSIFILCASTLAQAKPATRLVTIGSAVSETVCALGHCKKIVAVDTTSQYPEELVPKATLGYYRNLSAEGILSQRPDVIIAADDIKPPQVVAQLKKTGITVHFIDNTKTLKGALDRINKLGDLLKEKARAKKLVSGIELQMKELKTKVEKSGKKPKVLFIYARGPNQLLVAGRETAASTMIELSGGILAFPEFEGYKPLTQEGLIKANPDIVVVTKKGAERIDGLKGLKSLPGMKLTQAGRNEKFVTIDDVLFLGFGPRIGEAAETLYKAIR